MKRQFFKGFFGVFGPPDEVASVRESIGLYGASDTDRSTPWSGSHGAVTGFECKGVPIESSIGELRGWFLGDLPGRTKVPWREVVDAVINDDQGFLTTLNGCFAILLIHVASGRTWAMSDRRAQQPLFSYTARGCVYVSTVAAAFCRLPQPPAFDTGWLYETVYFNHPVLDTSFLEGVSRVPPATIIGWRPGDQEFSRKSWAAPFSRPDKLVGGEDAARLELATFNDISEDFYDDDLRTAIALTAGFDSRAVLASAPRRSDLLTYTYGMADCKDLIDAAAVAKELGVRHVGIELSNKFVQSLPELMVATVRDSDGLERVLRAELLAAYPVIADMGRNVSIGGVSGDHIFRDHLNGTGNVPHIISASMMEHIHGYGDGLEDQRFCELFGDYSDDFRTHIRACLSHLNDRHGDVRRPEGYQRYLVYESAPKHFGGEAAVASRYVAFRSFYWDPRMVELSFISDRATLGLSERYSRKNYFVESSAQAGVIVAGKHYGGGRIHGIHAATWARDCRVRYLAEKLLVKGPRFIANGFRRPKHGNFLDWPAWLSGPAAPLCRELLGPNSRLRGHLGEYFLNTFEPESDLRLASRLLTAELVIRLLEERWPSDFQVDGVSCHENS